MTIPGYTIEQEIGQGGMATVYMAIQQSLERKVALKVMAPALAAESSFCERFLSEGKIIAKLTHPGIVTIHDIGVAEPNYYMAMEYVSAGSLEERIQQGLSIQQAVEIVKQVAAALGYAHRNGVVHRDVKPANILFRDDGTVVLSDFGIAKVIASTTELTRIGLMVGTPNYISPEQAAGREVDARSDLYSLGIIFYEMLANRKPYEAADHFATALMHVNNAIPKLPQHIASFQPFVDCLMAKDPAERFPDPDALINALTDAHPAGTVTRVIEKPSATSPSEVKAEVIGHGVSRVLRLRQAFLVAAAGSLVLVMGWITIPSNTLK